MFRQQGLGFHSTDFGLKLTKIGSPSGISMTCVESMKVSWTPEAPALFMMQPQAEEAWPDAVFHIKTWKYEFMGVRIETRTVLLSYDVILTHLSVYYYLLVYLHDVFKQLLMLLSHRNLLQSGSKWLHSSTSLNHPFWRFWARRNYLPEIAFGQCIIWCPANAYHSSTNQVFLHQIQERGKKFHH